MNHDITQAKFYYGLCKNIYWIVLWAKKMSHPAERARFLYELNELVGVVYSAKKYFWSGFNVKCTY